MGLCGKFAARKTADFQSKKIGRPHPQNGNQFARFLRKKRKLAAGWLVRAGETQ
jgi:hypothetical protein